MQAFFDALPVAYRKLASLPDRFRPSNSRLIEQYFSSGVTKKLHLGCGFHVLPNWLNTDLVPSREVAYLDLTKRFPFESATFDYVFSEHAIEHIPYEKGLGMLQESFRVLRPGGKIRIVTPDFAFLKSLYEPEKNELQKSYLAWAKERWLGGRSCANLEIHVINNFFRNWGHQFIYDASSLTAALLAAGFSNVSRCRVNESENTELRGLENETRMPVGFLQLESIVLEAQKVGPQA
jgi:predicted SAM-dependent methyltransferase